MQLILMKSNPQRCYYIDWLRVLAMLSIFFFQADLAEYLFDSGGLSLDVFAANFVKNNCP